MENTQTAKVTNKPTAKVAATSTVKNCRVTFGSLVGFDAKLLSAARASVSELRMVVRNEDGTITPASQIYTANGKYYNFQDVGRAMELSDGSFLWIEKAEIESCKAPSSNEINITEFFPISQVDPILFDASYFIAPDPGKVKKNVAPNPNNQSSIAYATLIQVMKEVGLAAKAKVEFKGKEHNAIIRVYNDNGQDVLMLHTIFCSNNVRTVDILRPTVELNPQLVAMCKDLIASQTVTFDPESIVSESEIRFEAMVENKRAMLAGQATPEAGAPHASSTANAADDLMAKMAASLHQAKLNKEAKTAATETVKA